MFLLQVPLLPLLPQVLVFLLQVRLAKLSLDKTRQASWRAWRQGVRAAKSVGGQAAAARTEAQSGRADMPAAPRFTAAGRLWCHTHLATIDLEPCTPPHIHLATLDVLHGLHLVHGSW